MPETSEQDNSQQLLLEVNKALDSGKFVYVRKMLQNMQDFDAALILESSTSKTRLLLWNLIDQDNHGEILEELSCILTRFRFTFVILSAYAIVTKVGCSHRDLNPSLWLEKPKCLTGLHYRSLIKNKFNLNLKEMF